MDKRENLIKKLKYLIAVNDVKQQQYQQENGFGLEVGCLTRESVAIGALYSQMQQLGVTFDDCR